MQKESPNMETVLFQTLQNFTKPFSWKKIYKSKQTYINMIPILPLFILLAIFYKFVTQISDVYKNSSFNLDFDILENVKMGSNNFTVYIMDNKSDTDVIWFHGRRVKKDIHRMFAERMFSEINYNLIVPFYRGFGPSNGKSNEVNIMADLCILSRIIKQRKKKTILFGQSLGCAAALFYNSLEKAKIVILENPFYSIKNLVKEQAFNRFVSFLLTQKWNNYKRISDVNNLVFLLSKNDELIPISNTFELRSLNQNAKVHIWQNAKHTDAFKVENNYFVKIANFMHNQ